MAHLIGGPMDNQDIEVDPGAEHIIVPVLFADMRKEITPDGRIVTLFAQARYNRTIGENGEVVYQWDGVAYWLIDNRYRLA